jgi:general secretion pathway protein J
MTASSPLGLRANGFTLVEVMVALLVMSLMAVMAWQGVDGMVRARDTSQRRLEATLRLNTALAQWQQDLASLQETPLVPGLRFDGATLQMTRRSPAGMQFVVWSVRGQRLLRWAGPPTTSNRELQDLWLRSQQLQGAETGQLVVLEGVSEWQVYFYRGNAWTNAQSSGEIAAPSPGASAPARQALPNGVRLVLSFGEGSGFTGNVTRDSVLGPQP